MLYREKNDCGIELHIDVEERELLYNTLRHYSAYGARTHYMEEQIPKICEILNVLDIPDRFGKEYLNEKQN